MNDAGWMLDMMSIPSREKYESVMIKRRPELQKKNTLENRVEKLSEIIVRYQARERSLMI